MNTNKSELRKKLKEKLIELTNKQFETKSSLITNKILQLPIWKEANIVGITLPIGKEVDTIPLIEQGWSENKTIAVPKTEAKLSQMDFYEINDFTKLEKSSFGILEPIISKTTLVEHTKIDLLIIPCLGFDEHLYRLGYGGGYYDRYLADFTGITCGIAFECQKIDQVPTERFDIPLHMIVTEEKVYT